MDWFAALCVILAGAILLLCHEVARSVVASTGRPPEAMVRWGIVGAGEAGLYGLWRAIEMPYGIAAWAGMILIILGFVIPFEPQAPGWKVYGPRARRMPPRPDPLNVRTRLMVLSMLEDGGIAGRITGGRFQGRVLGDLDLAQLLMLMQEVRQEDPLAVPLLEAFLDHGRFANIWRERRSAPRGAETFRAERGGSRSWEGRQKRSAGEDDPARGWTAGNPGAGSRDSAKGGGRSATVNASRAAAYQLLGLAEGAGADEIKKAHRQMMRAHHPDHGGSTEMAQQLNLAKELLLRTQGR